MSFELLGEAIVAGVLLGCFYAAVSVGLSVAFGLLDVPQIAHPAFLVLGAYGAYWLGGFGVAAAHLGLTQPSISVRIKELEREVGTKLFYRVGRNVRLSEAGVGMFDYVEGVIRWHTRVGGYALLLVTDEDPPFRIALAFDR